MTSDRFHSLFGGPPRRNNDALPSATWIWPRPARDRGHHAARRRRHHETTSAATSTHGGGAQLRRQRRILRGPIRRDLIRRADARGAAPQFVWYQRCRTPDTTPT
jgi:hypothetical protein